MAASCPKCGAAVVPGMRTCQFCSAPVEYIEPDPAEEQQADQPAGTPPPAPAFNRPVPAAFPDATLPRAQAQGAAKTAAKKGGLSPALSIVVGVGAGIVILFVIVRILIILPIFGGGTLTFGDGAPRSSASSSSGGASAGGLGVDIYPGAQTVSAANSRTTSDGSVTTATFVSADTTDQVIAFYKARMVGQTAIYASGNGVVVSLTPSLQESVQVAIDPAQSGGKTEIRITDTKTANAQ